MIFGIVDRLGGELSDIIQQFTMFLLQASVARIWIDFTILGHPIEIYHALDVGWYNGIGKWYMSGCTTIYLSLVGWREVDDVVSCRLAWWLRSGDRQIFVFLTKLYSYIGISWLSILILWQKSNFRVSQESDKISYPPSKKGRITVEIYGKVKVIGPRMLFLSLLHSFLINFHIHAYVMVKSCTPSRSMYIIRCK